MLKFYPEQVARHWEKISYAIEQALPPIADSRSAEDRMNKILESILAGRMEVHVFVVYKDEQSIIYAIISTAVAYAIEDSSKELLIYSLYASQQLSREILYSGMDLIKKYAKAQGCKAVVAYSNVEGLKTFFKTLGGSSTFTYLRLEV